ncbi:glycine--tRNA ligase subunit beta [Rhodovibrio sodomensis]|uniref:Glycine--tRNA ligase beta subunit n=1 Tax=Rhodovibrio sodomensis TaxID=1088 RepID=A0ABS1DG08_9PROT|nr:glycine--tRNA ligase subunit beta [Rhodovibrio sodomensis]MBK1668448.1 glycine--tRNA ligase subunit beta [Rhodovibrio sodomensis]
MPQFLLELRSEEIPARMQAKACADLQKLAQEKLKAASLSYETLASYVTPRRLTLVVDGLPDKQPDTREEKKGPKVDAPQKAIEGFLRSVGLNAIDQAERRETDKGTFLFHVREIAGRPTAEVLAEMAAELPMELPWPKSMRWAETTQRYVRPLHGVLALFDGAAVPGRLDLGRGEALEFTTQTRGHPFMAPERFAVADFDDYRDKLARAGVVLSHADRRERIRASAERAAGDAGLRLRPDDGLLDENAGLTEWPVVLLGRIEDRFMALPPEVLQVSMRTHQKYFATETPDGQLANRFIVVANIETPDDGAAIVAGNERVLRARLADAEFFWQTDRQQPLRDRVAQLHQVVFQERLGTLHDKVERMQTLAAGLAEPVGADRDKARSGAYLAKADLVTGMVDEFPELQGLMGSYYAEADGEAREVVRAVAEHYSPLGPSDACPSAPASVAVALADKLDTLVGFFAIDEKPTGSKDPYALRRAALGVVRLITDNGLRVGLRAALKEAHGLLPEAVRRNSAPATVADQVLAFLTDRLKVVLRDRGVRHDLIAAVFAVERPEGGPEDDLVRLLARVDALRAFLETDDGANLLVAYRRAANIVRIEEKKDKQAYDTHVAEDALQEATEAELYRALTTAANQANAALAQEDFQAAMRALADLRAPVDAFFEGVTVNAQDQTLRANRLRLLKRIGTTLAQVADFSKIEG